MPMVDKKQLEQLSKEELIELLQHAETASVDAGIVRTKKGALLVRVSDQRWPIAMYRNDWEILLSKVDLIQAALKELNILPENPDRGGVAAEEQLDPGMAAALRIIQQRGKKAA